MKRLLGVVGLVLCSEVLLAETDCAAVVAATVEELSLTAASPLSDQQLQLIRSASGSSCLKAASGRFDDGLVVETLSNGDDPQRTSAVAEPDESGFKVVPMSGGPSRKPYERARSSGD